MSKAPCGVGRETRSERGQVPSNKGQVPSNKGQVPSGRRQANRAIKNCRDPRRCISILVTWYLLPLLHTMINFSSPDLTQPPPRTLRVRVGGHAHVGRALGS